MANEEPPYDVVHKSDIYEIRHYSDRLVVQVIKISDNRSFRQLFNYISGGNSNEQKIEMTIPVTQNKKDNKSFMQFFLPSRFTKETAPTPSNPDIEIVTIKDHILEDRIESVKKFEINSTPTLIINNKKFDKPLTYKNLKKTIEKLI